MGDGWGGGGRKQVGRMFNRACLFLSRMDEPPASYMDLGQMDKESFFLSTLMLLQGKYIAIPVFFYARWMEVEWRIGETIWKIWEAVLRPSKRPYRRVH